jgi:membrane protein implicated in regulation of membrane protease activity
VLGSAYLAACIFSIPAILLGKGRLWALKALHWGLVVLVLATLLVSLLLSRRVRKREREWDEGEEQDEGLISVRKLDMVLLPPATPGIV